MPLKQFRKLYFPASWHVSLTAFQPTMENTCGKARWIAGTQGQVFATLKAAPWKLYIIFFWGLASKSLALSFLCHAVAMLRFEFLRCTSLCFSDRGHVALQVRGLQKVMTEGTHVCQCLDKIPGTNLFQECWHLEEKRRTGLFAYHAQIWSSPVHDRQKDHLGEACWELEWLSIPVESFQTTNYHNLPSCHSYCCSHDDKIHEYDVGKSDRFMPDIPFWLPLLRFKER